MNISGTHFDNIIQRYFSDRPDILEVWQFIRSNPNFTAEILKNIDEAITLFNAYKHENSIDPNNIPLRSAVYLKEILQEDLPSVEMLVMLIKDQDQKVIQTMIDYIKDFGFIKTLRPMENCAGTLLLGSYRCAMRAIYPYIKGKNGQVSSSLEEMVALMAIHGQGTKLFDAVRYWYKDYEEEGFTKELSEAVSKL